MTLSDLAARLDRSSYASSVRAGTTADPGHGSEGEALISAADWVAVVMSLILGGRQ